MEKRKQNTTINAVSLRFNKLIVIRYSFKDRLLPCSSSLSIFNFVTLASDHAQNFW